MRTFRDAVAKELKERFGVRSIAQGPRTYDLASDGMVENASRQVKGKVRTLVIAALNHVPRVFSESSSSSSWQASPNLPRARNECDENPELNTLKLAVLQRTNDSRCERVDWCSRDARRGCGVECMLERIEQKRIASKLRDPVLNDNSQVASDEWFLGVAGQPRMVATASRMGLILGVQCRSMLQE